MCIPDTEPIKPQQTNSHHVRADVFRVAIASAFCHFSMHQQEQRMKHKSLVGISLLAALSLGAAELRESTLVQVVNEVKVAPPQAAEKDAKANDKVQAPDKIRTGAKSRAELKAADNTLTRIGA